MSDDMTGRRRLGDTCDMKIWIRDELMTREKNALKHILAENRPPECIIDKMETFNEMDCTRFEITYRYVGHFIYRADAGT